MRHAISRSKRLLTMLILAGSPASASAADPAPSWVFFTDQGRDDAALAAAIDARTAELSPRALARRQRARGDQGVDARDLTPDSAHLAAVLGTGARLRSTSRWLNAVSVEADPAQLAAIARLPGVVHVQPVARHRRLAPPSLARANAAPEALAADPRRLDDEHYGIAREQLDALGIPYLRRCGLTGKGVVVGIQDTGFWLEHAALKGVDVIAARDFLNDDDIVADEAGQDPKGQHNHGTMILSLLAGHDPGHFMGAAPGVSLILSKTEEHGVEAQYEEDRFVEGLEWIESMGADVFTASLGYSDWYAPEDLDGDTAVTSRAAAVAAEQGLLVLIAVGNAGPDAMTLLAPSDAEGVIAVGAVDLDGIVADFSSRGPTADGRIKPDLAAPGQDIWVADPNTRYEYGQGDGTSLATPLAAGAAALLMEAFPQLDAASMRALLLQSSSQADAPDNELGHGLLDAQLPVEGLCTCIDDDLDGALTTNCGGDDCDDADPAVHAGAIEVCSNGRDDDCNELVDDADPACTGGNGDDASAGNDEANGAGDDSDPGEAGSDAQGCTVASAREAQLPPFLLLIVGWLGIRRRRRPSDGA